MTHHLGPGPDYRPLRGEPNDHVAPAERARMYAEGRARLDAVLAARDIRAHGSDRTLPDTTCTEHPDERGGTTPAGDAYCPDCRRAGRARPTKESDR